MLNFNGSSILADTGGKIPAGYENMKQTGTEKELSVSNAENTDNTHEINLSDLKVGDVFRGEILDIQNHEVSILLEDNSVVNAMLKQSFELNIGQNVIFQVKNKTENQIFLKPLEQNNISPELVRKSLEAAGLSINDKNSMIVNSLIEKGQPIDRQTIIDYIKLSNQYGLENIDKLIDMTKQGIKISSENMEMYDKYVSSTHQISSDIQNLSDNLSGYLENLLEGNATKNTQEINKLVNTLYELSEVIDSEIIDNNSAEKVNVSENGSMKTEAEAGSEMVFKKGEINTETGKYEINGAVSGKNQENTAGIEKAVTAENITDSDDMAKQMHSEVVTKEDTLKNIADDIRSMINSLEESTNAVKKHDVLKLKERIKGIFEDKLKFNYEADKESSEALKQQVDKLYEKLLKTSDIIKNNYSENKNSELGKSAEELKNNLSFMNDLNQLESYVQLPVKFSTQDANGDLYVYNRKRKGKNAEDSLTAFLHLDLEFLGATDINVTLKNKGVSIVFTLDNTDSEKLVLEHINELVTSLEDKGYKAKIDAKSVIKKEDETVNNALLPITKENEKSVSIKRYTFDIRT